MTVHDVFSRPGSCCVGYYLYEKLCFRSKPSLGRAANALLDAPLQHSFVVFLADVEAEAAVSEYLPRYSKFCCCVALAGRLSASAPAG